MPPPTIIVTGTVWVPDPETRVICPEYVPAMRPAGFAVTVSVVFVTLLPAGETESHVLFPLLVEALAVKLVALVALTESC